MENTIIMVKGIFWEEKITKTDLKVYAVLCEHMSIETATCFPSYKTIAKKAGCSRVAAINSVKKLIEKGYIEKTARFAADGDQDSNMYTLVREFKRIKDYRGKKKNKTSAKAEVEAVADTEVKAVANTEVEASANINKIREAISEPLTDKEIEAILKAADGNIEKIKEKYEIAKSQSCNNLVGFLIKAIKDNYQPNINKSVKKKCKFQNYTSERKIDPERLEEIERVKLARKMDEIGRKEKAKEEKVSEEKPEIILRSFTQNELNNLFESYKESFDYGLSLVGRPITNNLSAQGLDLSYKFLPEADLSNSDLTGADLTGINLEQANLTGVRFGQAKLNNANLKEADLREADLTNADLTGADLTGANLRKAKLKGIKLKGTKLKNIEADRDNWEYLRSLRE